MKLSLFCLSLLAGPAALAQRPAAFPPLPEISLTATAIATTVRSEAGVRYQYQLVHLDNHRIWLAPAWHGQTKLEPTHQFLNPSLTGDVDALLMQTLNELAATGWELVEIRTVNQPVRAVQKLEKENKFNDPEKPVYTGTTSVETSTQTHYLFRKAS